MATNTVATKQTHTAANNASGNTSGPYTISFDYLLESDVEVRVDNTLKTQTTHYTFPSKTSIQFTSGNFPTLGTTIEIKRNTDITVPKVDFQDGSVLTESDLDNNSKHLLFGMQETKEDTESLVSTFVSPTAPTGISNGARWYDTVSGRTFIYYVDTDSAQWVEASPPFDATEALQINYTASGTGAVTRTVDSKLEDVVSVKDFGAVGDGTTDDTAAIQAAINSGKTLRWLDGTYKIVSSLTRTLTSPLRWYSDGATIKLESSSSIQKFVDITSNGNDVNIFGELTLDCNQKSFIGLFIKNDTTTFSDVIIRDINVKNAFRASQSFTGGDGIFISGSFTKIILQNPDIRDVIMAASAGISGSQGVSGITINSAGADKAPQRVDIINAHIENIYSQDASYKMDQDGIKIFTEEDEFGEPRLYEGSFSIRGGSINNCGGRAIKSQMEHGVIDGVKFSRDSSEISQISGTGDMPEIDFQVGGGIVTNTEYRYSSATPIRVISFSGTRQTGKYSFGGKVLNANVSTSGTGNLPRFVTLSMFNQDRYQLNVSNVNITGADELDYFATCFQDDADGTYSQSGTTVTITITKHGFIVGDNLTIDYTSGSAVDGSFTVASVIDANTFTVTAGSSATNSGNVSVYKEDKEAYINIENILAKVNSSNAFVQRLSTARPNVYVSGKNLVQQGSSTSFFKATTSGNFVQDLSGINVRVI